MLGCFSLFPFFRYIFTQQMSFSGDQEPKFSRQEIGILGKEETGGFLKIESYPLLGSIL